jgi:hypothetical protein
MCEVGTESSPKNKDLVDLERYVRFGHEEKPVL